MHNSELLIIIIGAIFSMVNYIVLVTFIYKLAFKKDIDDLSRKLDLILKAESKNESQKEQ